jgi:hypothetical protein
VYYYYYYYYYYYFSNLSCMFYLVTRSCLEPQSAALGSPTLATSEGGVSGKLEVTMEREAITWH